MCECVIKFKKKKKTAKALPGPQCGWEHHRCVRVCAGVCGGVRVCAHSVSKHLIRTAAYGHLNDCVADGPFKLLIHNPIKATLGEFCAIWLLIQYLSFCRMMDEVLSAVRASVCVCQCVC